MEPRLDLITWPWPTSNARSRSTAVSVSSRKASSGQSGRTRRLGANGAIAMFKLEGGLLLNLYPRADLAKDAAIPAGPPQSGEFSLAQLVRSRDEVDELLETAAAAGATVTPAHDRPWGIYSGYFRDPDGHLWEVIWNPDGGPKPRG